MTHDWACIEDFATLYQYCWYRDFPIDQKAIGAKRTDWTIHIGIVVHNVADLLGYVTRYERRGRTDAVLRGVAGDEIAIEWEWGGVWGNELEKLKNHEVVRTDAKPLRFACLITYTHTPNIETVHNHVMRSWEGASWPLLLILVDVVDVSKSKLPIGKEFNNLQMSVFDKGKRTELRASPALPWHVTGTRWSKEHVGEWR